MVNLQTSVEYRVITDDSIIPRTKNSNNPSSETFFMIQVRVQQFLKYLQEEGDSIMEAPDSPLTVKSFYLPSDAVMHDDDSIYEILCSVGVPLYSMVPIIRRVSSFARNLMSQPTNFGRPLIPIVLGIAIITWDPTDAVTAHQRKFGEIEEEPTAKRQSKDERRYRVCLTPVLGIRYRAEVQ